MGTGGLRNAIFFMSTGVFHSVIYEMKKVWVELFSFLHWIPSQVITWTMIVIMIFHWWIEWEIHSPHVISYLAETFLNWNMYSAITQGILLIFHLIFLILLMRWFLKYSHIFVKKRCNGFDTIAPGVPWIKIQGPQ